MFHRWAALVLVLAFCAMTPKYAAGQQTQQPPRGQSRGAFGRAYPNPFNPDVKVPFNVDVATCTDGSQQHVVSMRILNILAQQVAIPVLYVNGSTSTPSPATSATGPITDMRLGCGYYTAYWDGKLQGTTKDAASGTYLVQLFVDGKAATTRIFFAK